MANLHKLEKELLSDGRITVDEVGRIKEQIESDGKLDYDDVIFLVDLLANAAECAKNLMNCFFPPCGQFFWRTGK